MNVGCTKILVRKPFAPRGAEAFAAHRPKVGVLVFGLPSRIMKFVTAEFCAIGAAETAADAITEMIEAGSHFDGSRNRPGHRVPPAVERDQLAGEQHQAAALGVARHACADGRTNGRAHGIILRKGIRKDFGETAAENQSIDVGWERSVVDGGELNEFRTTAAEVIKV